MPELKEQRARSKQQKPSPSRHPRTETAPVSYPTANPKLEELLQRIAIDYPDLILIESAHFSWHAGKRHISYRNSSKNTTHGIFALLHELGHAILSHADYKHDIELLQLEVVAWDKARELASHYGIELDEDYVQNCLDTYRDWLHLRATCPLCFARSLQASERRYRCFNCGAEWSVTRSRLCRPYRLTKKTS